MAKLKFTKMHGAGNDYIYMNGFTQNIENPSELAIKLSDRHFGIGSDGLVLILPSEIADIRMQMFNSDGSEAEMCGNASRCVGKYAFDNGLTEKTRISLETKAGIKYISLLEGDANARKVTVDMGEPILEAAEIPVVAPQSPVLDLPLTIDGKEWKMTCVSMGNPHAVTFTTGIKDLNLPEIGPKFETNAVFPRKTNTEFIEVVDRKTLNMRVWERGAGETLACGTGACASAVAAVLKGLTDREVTIHLLGGDLHIEWRESDNHVYMTGEAVTVFSGEI
ncbi:MAG: diaminopimelate epimerase [Dysgonamonadaceae bacterium]